MRLAPFILLIAACTSTRTIGQPNLSVREERIQLVRRDKVDILFMVDNSPSMSPKQAALRAAFPQLLTRIQTLATSGAPASFHIGVVDSDLGAGPYTLNQGQCHPDGDGGRLHIGATAVGAPPACAALKLGGGESFIDYDSSTGVSNVGGGVDLATAFSCISSVGESGCGFEHQLESVYRTLTTPALNPGFVRDDALLVVVWLTDEDDCSAPPDSDLFDPSAAGVAKYGTLHSFRCTQFGITCDGKPLTGGALTTVSCAPLIGGPLFDVQRYIDLFTRPRAAGGIKDLPSDVLLVSLSAPTVPFDVVITAPCQDQVNTPSCPILSHACQSTIDPTFSADPAVRLHTVVSATLNHVESSICDTDYMPAIDTVADAMSARMRAGCLPGAVVDRADPGCVVTIDGVDAPRCSTGRLPCWDLVDDGGCAVHPSPAGAMQQLRFTTEGASSSAVVIATCPLYEP